MNKYEWTLERDNMLTKAYHDGIFLCDICKLIGASEYAIRNHIKLLGIRRTTEYHRNVRGRWTQEQDDILITGYRSNVSNATIAAQISKSVSAVGNRADELGLRKVRRGARSNNHRALAACILNARMKYDQPQTISTDGVPWREAVMSNGCRAVLGDVVSGKTRGCGCKRIVGKPYCEEHYKLYYTKEEEE